MYLKPKTGMTTLERAFELAAAGKFASPQQLKRQLSVEGFDTGQLYGRELMKQLGARIKAAREVSQSSSPSAPLGQTQQAGSEVENDQD
jgi:hypothetical protein